VLTLARANRIIDAILARGAELQCRPLAGGRSVNARLTDK